MRASSVAWTRTSAAATNPEHDVEGEQAAHGPGPPQEPLVERAHAQAAGEPPAGAATSPPPTRPRNTWYVQPW